MKHRFGLALLALPLIIVVSAASSDSDSATASVEPLNPELLSYVRDLRDLGGLGTIGFGPGKPEQKVPGVYNNPEEGAALRDAIIKAARTRPEVFAQAARRDLRISDFLNEATANVRRENAKLPGDAQPTLRGTVVHVEGSLIRGNAQTVPLQCKRAGVSHLYEGWVVDKAEASKLKVWCMLFPDMPDELAHHDEDGRPLPVDIEFDGYYFKVMTYEELGTQKNPKRTVEAVVVVGRTPILKAVEATQRDPWKEFMAPGIAVFVCLTLGLVGLLTWSYYRGDRRIKAQLEAKRSVTIPDIIPGELREESILDAANEPDSPESPDFAGKSLNPPPRSE